MQNALIKTTPQSLQKLSKALAITEKLLEDDNPLGLPELIPYRKGDKWGFCNRKKEIVIACEYDKVEPFEEGLARVEVKVDIWWDRLGYIDMEGNKVIPLIYFSSLWDFLYSFQASGFSQGFKGVIVGKEGKCGFIDKTGNVVIPFIYDNYKDFAEGLAQVKINDKWGGIDKTGNVVIPFIYDYISCFAGGLARVHINDKWGVIDKTGNEIAPLIYEEIIHDGITILFGSDKDLIAVKLNDKWGVIDKTGNEITPHIYDKIDFGSDEDLIAVRINDNWRWIDKTGNVATRVRKFYDGLEKVKKNGKYGFLDREESMVIPFIYDYAYDFSEGLARVQKNDMYLYIDKKGTEYYEEEVFDDLPF